MFFAACAHCSTIAVKSLLIEIFPTLSKYKSLYDPKKEFPFIFAESVLIIFYPGG